MSQENIDSIRKWTDILLKSGGSCLLGVCCYLAVQLRNDVDGVQDTATAIRLEIRQVEWNQKQLEKLEALYDRLAERLRQLENRNSNS